MDFLAEPSEEAAKHPVRAFSRGKAKKKVCAHVCAFVRVCVCLLPARNVLVAPPVVAVSPQCVLCPLSSLSLLTLFCLALPCMRSARTHAERRQRAPTIPVHRVFRTDAAQGQGKVSRPLGTLHYKALLLSHSVRRSAPLYSALLCSAVRCSAVLCSVPLCCALRCICCTRMHACAHHCMHIHHLRECCTCTCTCTCTSTCSSATSRVEWRRAGTSSAMRSVRAIVSG